MYPNPANELVSVKLNSPVSLIQIFSITGILTKQIRPENNAVSEIPISDLTRGTYIVVVRLMFFHLIGWFVILLDWGNIVADGVVSDTSDFVIETEDFVISGRIRIE